MIDLSGNRGTKTTASTTTTYRRDENASLPMLARELNGASALRSYRYGPDTGNGLGPISITSGSNAYYLRTDQVGSTSAITMNRSGNGAGSGLCSAPGSVGSGF